MTQPKESDAVGQSVYARFRAAYNAGARAYRTGRDGNPFGTGSLLEMCAWSAGHFDAKRGMI